MKKHFLWALMCLCVFTGFAEDEPLQVLLHHQGAVTMFNKSDFTSAINAAQDGDTLYLPKGEFPGFTMEKEFTVRGAGNNETTISETVNIGIPGKPILSQTLLEGVKCSSDVDLTTIMTNVKIKQCNLYSFNVSNTNTDILLDRCYISTYSQSSNINRIKVMNSIIDCYHASSETAEMCSEFINCKIYGWKSIGRQNYPNYSNLTYAFFTNCIVQFSHSSYYNSASTSGSNSIIKNLDHASFVNCVLTSSVTANLVQDCYVNSNIFNFTEEDWENNNYLGTDGTRVGTEGGTTPYTLDLSIPKITETTISHDVENRILNVKLKVTAK